MAAPVSALNGSMQIMEDLPEVHLAICGAMIPANPTGPQKAVEVPARMQQLATAQILILFTLPPDATVNSSPKSMRVSPL